jgi:hypothetical protein
MGFNSYLPRAEAGSPRADLPTLCPNGTLEVIAICQEAG